MKQADNINGLIDAALSIADRRAKLISDLRSALLAGQDSVALQLARIICGISKDNEASNRTHQGLNGAAGRI